MDKPNYIWIGIAIGLLGGILLGMQIQQMMFMAIAVEFGESLEGVNLEVNVDLNETQIIDGIRDRVLPLIKNEVEKEDE